MRNLGSSSLYGVKILTRVFEVVESKMAIYLLKINVEGSYTTQNVPFNEFFSMVYKHLPFRVK